MSDFVTASGYLVIEASALTTATTVRDAAKITRVTAGPPRLSGLEVAVRVSIRIAKGAFDAAIADVMGSGPDIDLEDARHAAEIGFGNQSNVYLRRAEHGNVELRLATG